MAVRNVVRKPSRTTSKISKPSKSLTDFVIENLDTSSEELVHNFFEREVKDLTNLIKTQRLELSILKHSHELTLEHWIQKLEDAHSNVKDSLKISKNAVLALDTNVGRDDFSKVYWERFENASKNVDSIQEQLDYIIADYSQRVSASKIKRDAWEYRLKLIKTGF